MTVPPSTPAPGWYPSTDGSGGQHYWNGQQWSDPQAPEPQKKQKRSKWPYAVTGVIGLLVGFGVASVEDGSKDASACTPNGTVNAQAAAPLPSTDTNTPAPTDTAPAPANTPTDTKAEVAGIGAPVRDGKFEFVVVDIDLSATAGDPTNPYLQSTATGEYLNVYLTVSNIGDAAQLYSASNQQLIVGGRKYDAASILGLQGDLTTINPGLSIDTIVSFDVPPGSHPDAVVLHDSMFSGGVTVSLR